MIFVEEKHQTVIGEVFLLLLFDALAFVFVIMMVSFGVQGCLRCAGGDGSSSSVTSKPIGNLQRLLVLFVTILGSLVVLCNGLVLQGIINIIFLLCDANFIPGCLLFLFLFFQPVFFNLVRHLGFETGFYEINNKIKFLKI